MSALIDDYDVVLSDLDGVLYVGPFAVEGVVEGVRELVERGVRVAYITNNAARSPEVVAGHLADLGYGARVDDVVTSSQAMGVLLRRELAPGTRVLVSGSAHLAEEVRRAGMVVVETADDEPDAVVQGYDPELPWPRIDEAAIAVQRGARWFATNPDLTRPGVRGLVPGLGAMIYAVAVTTDQRPTIAGKPYPPLLEAALARMGARRPLFTGDRIDTDIMGANAVGIDSFLVFTGAHGVRDLCEAPPNGRPTAIGWSLASVLRPRRVANLDADGATCGAARVRVEDGRAVVEAPMSDREEQLDAAWALATLVWSGRAVAEADAFALFDLLP